MIRSAPLLVLLLFGSCVQRGVTIELCDDYANGECRRPVEAERVYRIDLPQLKQRSWFEMGYYLYFHSRETPGLRVDFGRTLSGEEVAVLRQSLICSYRLRAAEGEASGHLEGVRIDPDGKGFWCFDYLGSMLVAYHKKYGSIQQPPQRTFFPIGLDLSFSSDLPGISGEKSAKIGVVW